MLEGNAFLLCPHKHMVGGYRSVAQAVLQPQWCSQGCLQSSTITPSVTVRARLQPHKFNFQCVQCKLCLPILVAKPETPSSRHYFHICSSREKNPCTKVQFLGLTTEWGQENLSRNSSVASRHWFHWQLLHRESVVLRNISVNAGFVTSAFYIRHVKMLSLCMNRQKV